MELNGRQKNQLNIALRDAFKQSSLEMMLKYELDKSLDDYAHGNFRETVFMLIEAAEREGWLGKLIDAAQKSNPGNPELQAFIQRIGLLREKKEQIKPVTKSKIESSEQDVYVHEKSYPNSPTKILVGIDRKTGTVLWETPIQGYPSDLDQGVYGQEKPKIQKDILHLSRIKEVLASKQQDFFVLLRNKPLEALKVSQETIDYLDQAIAFYPNEYYLQLVKGYIYKNKALAQKELECYKEAEEALNNAEKIFSEIKAVRPNDPYLWNGLGNVEAVRENHKQALIYYDHALNIDPDCPVIKLDRQQSLQKLQKRATQQSQQQLEETSDKEKTKKKN